MKTFTAAAALALLAGPVFADAHASGDAAAGGEQFNRQCVACHVVVNDAGETLAGRNAQTGPNLYNIVSRGIGQEPDFNYGDSMLELGATGAMWTEENFVAYVQDPTGYLRTALDDNRARGKMAYQVRDAGQATDIYAFLASLDTGE